MKYAECWRYKMDCNDMESHSCARCTLFVKLQLRCSVAALQLAGICMMDLLIPGGVFLFSI